MTKRINARIDAEMARKLKALQSRTGKSTTAILKESIDAYYASIQGAAVTPAEALGDLVGCASGPEDLAANYKQYLTESLSRKTGKARG